jgi:hypothetical protein
MIPRQYWKFCLLLPLWLLTGLRTAEAHVGTTTVFVQGNAGPYPVYVSVTPPAVVPGEAQVSVLCDAPGVRAGAVQANVLAGGTQYMPERVALKAGPAGSHEWHGSVWLMTQGSWQVRVTLSGEAGDGVLAVPVTASPTRLMTMSRPFGALLIVLGGLLIVGLASIGAALVGEAQDEPGTEPTPARARMGRRAAVVTVLGCGVLLVAGNRLWTQEIARYSGNIYRPLAMRTELEGGVLHLKLAPPSAAAQVFSTRRLDDLVLDHDHLMHLYLLRWPAMDEVLHLHPEQVSAGRFDLRMPSVEAGEYRLFADVVHADGFPETAVGTLGLPRSQGRPLAGDDAGGALPGFGTAMPRFQLADGYTYYFMAQMPGGSETSEVRAGVPVLLRFTLLDPEGRAATGMESYMGMSGHLAVVKQDGTVFAHIHPNGSAAMAATMLANPEAGMQMAAEHSNVVAFPFEFPSGGRYRLVVQMKHGGVVETGAVDMKVQ